jgi:hypothetical protein
LLIRGSEKEKIDIRKGDADESPGASSLSERRGREEIIVMASQHLRSDHNTA